MSYLCRSLLACSAAMLLASPAYAKSFTMQVSAGAAACVPNAAAQVIVRRGDSFDKLNISVSGLPAQAKFDVFVIQVPTAPFGFSWYQGDITTDANGAGRTQFRGRFNKETVVIDPNTAPAPVVFPTDGSANPAPLDAANPSIQTYHLGLWFDSPAAAAAAGCPNTQTPFNGEHNAGIQVLNTANFPADSGPLRHIR